jgi:hypothetical protein
VKSAYVRPAVARHPEVPERLVDDERRVADGHSLGDGVRRRIDADELVRAPHREPHAPSGGHRPVGRLRADRDAGHHGSGGRVEPHDDPVVDVRRPRPHRRSPRARPETFRRHGYVGSGSSVGRSGRRGRRWSSRPTRHRASPRDRARTFIRSRRKILRVRTFVQPLLAARPRACRARPARRRAPRRGRCGHE